MEEETNNKDVVFDIETVVTMLEDATDVKFKLASEFDKEYVAQGQVTEQQLTDIGFEYVGISSGIKCPMYQFGKNIEAIFDESLLHIYDLRG